ncbi:MAG TPA: ATP-binding protein, partial [Acidobacteriota bacterium]|nr:ATP-binding protein [Acidobacteriota bacterium]
DWAEVLAAIDVLRREGVSDFAAYFREHPEFVERALAAVKILDVNQWTVELFGARDKAEMLASLGTVFATPDTLPGFVGELLALAGGATDYRTEMMLNTVKGDLLHTLLAMSFSPSGRVLVSVVDITERKKAEKQIRRLNEQLGARAHSLEQANKELESFSYSVSHDLRTPLRSIDGFSRFVLEDCADKLDEENRENLHRIRAASQRMGHLIDDILRLARLTRAELHRGPVDLSALARALGEELQRVEPARQVEFVIEPNLVADADANLMRAVLENLLGNAWKFTGRCADAKIEFGCTSIAGVPTYFVRDNGVGFDMQYAAKLFNAFTRLHADADFPGTGIGLASVQRIIHRHGGRVWATGEVGKGATCYFTLTDGNDGV